MITILLGSFFLSGCGNSEFFDLYEVEVEIPYYYIVVHNLPYHGERTANDKIKKDYERLKEMISRADEYGIKLVLMFPPQWVGHIKGGDISVWKDAGHEIAVRHYGVLDENWDGYSDLSKEEVLEKRKNITFRPERYLGDMNDFMGKMKELDIELNVGCVNGEDSLASPTKRMAYEVCSEFANFGQGGKEVKNFEAPLKGINEFMSIGQNDQEEVKRLTHYLITDLKKEKKAEDTFYRMRKGVFGSGFLSAPIGSEVFFTWLDFLHQRDRLSERSLTISEMTNKGLLPEKQISFE